ncbi:MAG: amidohydrolase [Proteiniphilum sp.]
MKRFILSLLLIFSMLEATSQSPGLKSADDFIDTNYPSLDKLYKQLHQNPELSLHEEKTSEIIASELKSLGFEVIRKLGAYSHADIYKNGKGPTVLIRTDMDALPVEEKTGLPYASKAVGINAIGNEVSVMHACGHDLHMTVFVGTARALIKAKDHWKGTLVMVAQSAEEVGLGADLMFKAGLYDKIPKPDYAIALHANPYLEAGKLGYREGAFLASVDMMDLTVFGEGGHGAAPHTTKDPIVLSAQMILDFQTIVSREINPLEPAVVTVGSIHGGTVHNIIPDEVTMQLTLRSYSEDVRNQIIASIHRISKNVALAAGLSNDKIPVIKIRDPYTPATINDAALTNRIVGVFSKKFGNDNVIEMPPYMVGEDFSRFGVQSHKVPIFMFWLGAMDPAKVKSAKEKGEQLPSLHSPYFAPLPEPAIKTGVKAMLVAAFELFNHQKP